MGIINTLAQSTTIFGVRVKTHSARDFHATARNDVKRK